MCDLCVDFNAYTCIKFGRNAQVNTNYLVGLWSLVRFDLSNFCTDTTLYVQQLACIVANKFVKGLYVPGKVVAGWTVTFGEWTNVATNLMELSSQYIEASQTGGKGSNIAIYTELSFQKLVLVFQILNFPWGCVTHRCSSRHVTLRWGDNSLF